MKNAKYNYFMKLNYDFYQLVHYESKKPHNPQLTIHIPSISLNWSALQTEKLSENSLITLFC